MKRFVCWCWPFLLALSADAQSSFPSGFIGHWKGSLLWYRTGSKPPQKVTMQLIIQPADSAHTYTWQLLYGDKGEDNRPYLLRPVDTAAGHWQVDERNGILIDLYLTGNRLTSAFSVQGTTIVNSYWLQGSQLVAEFYSLTAKPVRESGGGTAEVPAVQAYGLKGYQKAVLSRRSKR